MADVALNFTGKYHGINLTSKPGHPTEAAYWIEWDWDNWIKKQIHYGLAQGANGFRLIGDVQMVVNSLISQNDYNAHLIQFAQECVRYGASVYYTGCATYDTNGTDNGTIACTNQQIADVIISNIAAITTSPNNFTANIAACDIVQEFNQLGSTRANQIYPLVKPSVPPIIPCFFSTAGILNSLDPIIASCDLLDFHIYPQIYTITGQPTPSDITSGPRASHPTKEIVFGEGGCNSLPLVDPGRPAYDSTQVQAWLTGMAVLCKMSDSKVRGGAKWAVQDQDDHYGDFLADWSPRSSMILGWNRGWGAALKAPGVPYTVEDVLTWDAHDTSSLFDSTRLYRNGTQIADQLFGRFDDSTHSAAAQSVYQVTAVAGVSESARSGAIVLPTASTRVARNRGIALTLRQGVF